MNHEQMNLRIIEQLNVQDGGTSLLEETARKQGESDGDQDDGTSRSDGDQLLSSSPDQVITKWM